MSPTLEDSVSLTITRTESLVQKARSTFDKVLNSPGVLNSVRAEIKRRMAIFDSSTIRMCVCCQIVPYRKVFYRGLCKTQAEAKF